MATATDSASQASYADEAQCSVSRQPTCTMPSSLHSWMDVWMDGWMDADLQEHVCQGCQAGNAGKATFPKTPVNPPYLHHIVAIKASIALHWQMHCMHLLWPY